MIKTIIDMLQLDEHLGKHEYIEVAKGKYKIETKIKQVYKQAKRELIIKKKTNG